MPMIKKSNELLIQVKAASLNVIDTKICSGYSRIYRRLLNSGVSKPSEQPIDATQYRCNARTYVFRNRKNYL